MPPLPSLKGIKSFFKPEAGNTRFRDVVREIPGAFAEFGQETLRGFGAVGSAIAGEPLTPEGQFQQDLFGTREEITLGKFGKEIRGADPLGPDRAIDPVLGLMMGLADAVPTGKQAKAVTKGVVKAAQSSDDFVKAALKYGRRFAQQINTTGGVDLLKSSLIRGNESLLANRLKLPVIEVTKQKLISAIQQAKSIRPKAEQLAEQARAARARLAEKAFETTEGEDSLSAALSQLKGELPRPKFEGVRDVVSQIEIDGLFEHIKTMPGLGTYDKINAQKALAKILGETGGRIPTKGELRLLRDAFGDELAQALLKKRSLAEKIKEGVIETLNVPRALMSSLDMSAPFRQGIVLSIHKPKQAIQAFKNMFGYFANPKLFDAAMDEIRKRPTAGLMRNSGLDLTDISGKAIRLSDKEESFMTNLAAKIPGLGIPVKASERAFVGFLNKLRADVFDDMTREFIAGGISPSDNPQVFKGLADFINASTGRGSLGKLTGAAPILNSAFFSPRFMAARLQMLNPKWYFNLPAPVRKEAVKSMVKFVGTGLAVLSIAKLGGAKVEDDPRSSDFGKIRIGNRRWDIWGGFQQWVRFTAQMITGQTKATGTGKIRSITGKEFPFETRLDRGVGFVSGKLSPTAALVADLLRGQTLIGEPITLKGEAFSKLVPLYLQDIADVIREEGIGQAASIGIPAFFGVGAQTFKPRGNSSPFSLPSLPKLPSL